MKSIMIRTSFGLTAILSMVVWQLATAVPAKAGCFDDGRINGNCAAPVAIYCTDDGGFEVYRFEGGKGEFATDVSADDIQEAASLPDEFWEYGYPYTVGLYFHISFSVTDEGSSSSYLIVTSNYLPDRQIQVNVQSSDILEGKEYIIRFDKCGGNVSYEKFVLPDEY
jgi:hypothetical protein